MEAEKSKEHRAFLGLANYYRKFIKKIAEIAHPLTELTKKDDKFEWKEEAFNQLKRNLTEHPVLIHFDEKAATELHVDACEFGLGAVLLQQTENGTHPVAYAARKLNDAETMYNTSEKECLAVVLAIGHFRPFLWRRQFKTVTDQHALCWLHKNKDSAGKLARWASKLQEYDYIIKHKNGKLHDNADGLSRAPRDVPKISNCNIGASQRTQDIKVRQLQDPLLSKIIEALSKGNHPDS
ncbi:MAG: Ty3/Gypsy family RNase HI domain-containing protein, partial [Providencia heimbachae]|nr:Ty3/Gypsy family RNase HI domain-containing protein [Providencia heimbachae]